MAMTEGIWVEELKDSSNNLIASVSESSEGNWYEFSWLIGKCMCVYKRQKRGGLRWDGSELLRAPANLGPLAVGTRPAGFSLSPQLDFAPNRLSSYLLPAI
jgi:hypothetical protein